MPTISPWAFVLDEWDATFVPADAARRQRLDFGPVYSLAESTFLVRPGVEIATLADVKKPGIHVAGIANTTTIRAMAAFLQDTTPKGLPTEGPCGGRGVRDDVRRGGETIRPDSGGFSTGTDCMTKPSPPSDWRQRRTASESRSRVR